MEAFEFNGGGLLGRLAGCPRTWLEPTAGRLTWEVLVEMEPRLAMAESVVALASRPLRESEWGGIRTMLDDLVGWHSPHYCRSVLGTYQAYDAAFGHLRDVSEGKARRRRRR